MSNLYKKFLYCSLFSLIAFGCKEDDNDQFSISKSIGFESTNGIVDENSSTGIRIKLYSNVAITDEGTVTINVSGLTYGVDYTTDDDVEVVDNTITLPFSPDTGVPSFLIYPILSSVSPRYLYFTITDVEGNGLELGQPVALSYLLSIERDFRVVAAAAFEDCLTDPISFTEENATGVANFWGCTNLGYPTETTKAAEANAFGKLTPTGPFNSYLIRAIPNASDYQQFKVKMMAYSHFTSTADESLKVRYSTNYSGTGNPEALGVTWTDMTALNLMMPAEGTRSWKEVSGSFNSSSSVLYIAIQYKGSTTPSTANYRVDNFEVQAK